MESPGISDAQVDRGRIAGPLLVPIDRAVPLRAEPAVHLQFAPVVLPGHAEHDDALPTNNPLDDLRLPVLRMLIQDGRARLSRNAKGGPRVLPQSLRSAAAGHSCAIKQA